MASSTQFFTDTILDKNGNTIGGSSSGTYTPGVSGIAAITNGANVAASTPYIGQYMRVGDVVTVSGVVDIDPTLTATTTAINYPLPIASNFATISQCAGTGGGVLSGATMFIYADVAANNAIFQFTSPSASNQSWSFTFTYLVV